jgi:hypothetical protein
MRSLASVPAPKYLGDLLTLINMLPVGMRYPHWARREQIEGTEFKLVRWHSEILHGPSMGMSYESIWYRLSQAIEELPLLLQAFLLRDQMGDLVETGDGYSAPLYLESDTQTEWNFELLGKSEEELKEVVKNALEKVEEANRREEKISKERIRIAIPETFPKPETLVRRIRQRLIFVMAAQELLSCLTHPNMQEQLNRTMITYHSDATRSIPYVNREGKFDVIPPVLYSRLQGVEVSRIKECAVCYQIFWAGRKDMRCCSTKCSHVFRSRKYREAYKERYAYQRYRKEEAEKKRVANPKKPKGLIAEKRRQKN